MEENKLCFCCCLHKICVVFWFALPPLSPFPFLFLLPCLSFPNAFFFSLSLPFLFPDSTQFDSAPCTPPHTTQPDPILFYLPLMSLHSDYTLFTASCDSSTRSHTSWNEATDIVVTNRACGVLVSHRSAYGRP